MKRRIFQPTIATTALDQPCWLWAAWGLALGLALLAGCRRKERAGPDTSDPIFQKAARLAKEQGLNDLHIWPQEVSALRHEEWAMNLWDQLRGQGTYASLQQARNLLTFQSLRLSPRGPAEQLEGGGTIIRPASSGEMEAWDMERWRSTLDVWHGQGFQLTRLELRHTKFEPAQRNAPNKSEFLFEFGLRDGQGNRRNARGTAKVTWEIALPGQTEPRIRDIAVAQFSLLERAGATPFVQAQRVDTPPSQTKVQMAPIFVHDLDGDERLDILLAGTNTVLRNQGEGFEPAELFPKSLALAPTGILADFTGDGRPDFLGLERDGQGVLMPGQPGGTFGNPARPWPFAVRYPSVLTAGDIDRDGDLDVWLAQSVPPYTSGRMAGTVEDANDGLPAILLRNNGRGEFSDVSTEPAATMPAKDFSTSANLLGHQRRTLSGSFLDMDEDGDPDLVTASHFGGLHLYRNEGEGLFFLDPTAFGKVPQLAQGHAIGHFGGHEMLDFFVAGEWSAAVHRLAEMRLERVDFPRFRETSVRVAGGNRVFVHAGGSSAPAPESAIPAVAQPLYRAEELADRFGNAGRTACIAACDFDNDGDDDAYAGTGYLSGTSAMDVESQFWRHDIFLAKGINDTVLARFFAEPTLSPRFHRLLRGELSWHGWESNRFLLRSRGWFLDVGYINGLDSQADSPGAITADLNGDGRLDLLVLEESHASEGGALTARQALQIYRNESPASNHWLAVRLVGHVPGHSAVGARVRLRGPFGVRDRVIATGENRFTQPPPVAHFGLGQHASVDFVEVFWPNGKKQVLQPSAVDCYVSVRPGLDFTPIPEPPEPPPAPEPAPSPAPPAASNTSP